MPLSKVGGFLSGDAVKTERSEPKVALTGSERANNLSQGERRQEFPRSSLLEVCEGIRHRVGFQKPRRTNLRGSFFEEVRWW